MFSYLHTWATVRRRIKRRPAAARYYEKHTAEINNSRRGYRAPNKKRSEAAWSAKNPGYYRKYQLKYKYGITLSEWEQMFDLQGRRCAICGGTKPISKGWHTDHDHETGRVRGILCQPCNHLLGNLGDTANTVRSRTAAILAYLERKDV